MTRSGAALGLLVVLAGALGCRQETGRLSPDQEQRFVAEGILHQADNLRFRWTQGAGRRGGTWEDRLASIVVTRRSVLIHKNGKVGIEITPDSWGRSEVHRDGEQVRISSGGGGSAETWSFVPPGDAEAWSQDIRGVIQRAPQSAAGRK